MSLHLVDHPYQSELLRTGYCLSILLQTTHIQYKYSKQSHVRVEVSPYQDGGTRAEEVLLYLPFFTSLSGHSFLCKRVHH